MLILAGVLSPLNLPLIDDANFIGYMLWSVWLVVFAVLLLIGRPRTGKPQPSRTEPLALPPIRQGDDLHEPLNPEPVCAHLRG